MNVIKGFWGWIVAIVGGVIGFLIYYLSLKNKQINKLKAKVELTETEKEADLLESDIKEFRTEKKRLKKEDAEISKVLTQLDDKRKQIKEDVKSMSDKQIEDYWNK